MGHGRSGLVVGTGRCRKGGMSPLRKMNRKISQHVVDLGASALGWPARTQAQREWTCTSLPGKIPDDDMPADGLPNGNPGVTRDVVAGVFQAETRRSNIQQQSHWSCGVQIRPSCFHASPRTDRDVALNQIRFGRNSNLIIILKAPAVNTSGQCALAQQARDA